MNNHRFLISNKTTESSYLLAVVMVAVNQFTGFGDRKICECSAKPLNKGNNYSQEIKNPSWHPIQTLHVAHRVQTPRMFLFAFGTL